MASTRLVEIRGEEGVAIMGRMVARTGAMWLNRCDDASSEGWWASSKVVG